MKLHHTSMAALLATSSLMLVLSAAKSSAATRYVWQASPSPNPPYTTWATAAHVIQQAVDAAQAGETVLVTNGIYRTGATADDETVSTLSNRVALTKAIRLESVNGPTLTLIEGSAAPGGLHNMDGAIRCVYVGANSSLSGFTLTNGHALYGGGATVEPSGVVSNCVASGNQAQVGGGIYGGTVIGCTLAGNEARLPRPPFDAYSEGGGSYGSDLFACMLIGNSADVGGGAARSRLVNCVLADNSAENSGGGATAAELRNCVVLGNSAGAGGGVSYGTLYNCTVTGNSAWTMGGGVIWAFGIYNSVVYDNTAPTGSNHLQEPDLEPFEYSCTSPMPIGPGNIAVDPLFTIDWHLSTNSPCRGAGSVGYASGADIDGEPWANPPSIGADELTVGAASARLALYLHAARMRFPSGLAAEFKAYYLGSVTRLVWDLGDGSIVTNQTYVRHAWDAQGVYTVRLTCYNESHPEGVSTTVQIEVITAIHYVNAANAEPVPPYISWATAATNIQDAIDADTMPGRTVLVTNGVFKSEPRVNWDSGLISLNHEVIVRSVNGPAVTIIDGAGVGPCADVGDRTFLIGFTLTNGVAWGCDQCGRLGGGGVAAAPSGVISNCVIVSNRAVGRFGKGGGAQGGILYHCTLSGNSATVGGGAFESTLHQCILTGNDAAYGGGAVASVLHGCALTGNTADQGGGVSSYWSGSALYDCTVTANTAKDAGGGAYGGNLFNCIVSLNQAPTGANYFADEGNPIHFEYSCATPLPPYGLGNIDADPRFVNAANGDFRLLPDSPCIDTGTNLSAFLTTDLGGLPRPLDGNGDGVARFDMGAYEFNPYRFAPTLQFNPDGFQFTVRGEPGKSVLIERSRDLVHWEFAGQVPIPASGQTLIDPAATTERQLFYRVISIP